MFAKVSRMTTWLTDRRRTFTVFSAVGLAACAHAYQPPSAGEPHAILKMRRTYEKSAGTQLSEVVKVGDDVGYEAASDATMASTPKMDAILVHPVPTELAFHAQFSHPYTHLVLEHYTEQEPYQAMESYSCGYGSSARFCTRSTTKYRSVSKTRWVNRTDIVVDGACRQDAALSPKQGSSYLLQYTYQDNGICSLSCFEQVPAQDGSINQKPCAP